MRQELRRGGAKPGWAWRGAARWGMERHGDI